MCFAGCPLQPATDLMDVEVRHATCGDTASLDDAFQYKLSWGITANSPTRGPHTGGTRLTVSGQGFTMPLMASICVGADCSPASVLSVSDSQVVLITGPTDSCNSGTNYRQAGTDITEPTPVEPLTDDAGIAAQMIHMGGCRDSNTSSGYLAGGAFTMALCNAWANADAASYRELYDAVVATVHTGQQPQYTEYGAVGDQFRGQRPFTI